MKITKKFVSIILVLMMLMTSVAATMTVSASTGKLCDYYATNPNNQVGVKKTITIDGSFSDWSEDMLIAQGAAWDIANHYKGGHENCVLDTYALYAAWDNDNLYVAWQMVNTTDTWAREGDGPLSDGGRVLDVPLILALSVDPSSTSMSALNTEGGPIWSKLDTLKFETHVDHLLYMSGKVGNGDPAMFTAVDDQGNTNYKEGCKLFKSSGIEYKMAEGNMCSSIMGLNYSEDPSDVYDNNADWVDYKTFKGSQGTHNTKYDSFYEIKIPLSLLGIDASYIENNGIGAMLVATRGESAIDCVPFDDTMLDNAKEEYGGANDNTSHEKDDIDVITSEFAKIGKTGSQPTPQPTTPQPTTQQPTTASNLVVNATSNLFPAKTATFSKDTKTVTVSYDLSSAMSIVNGQWSLSYDPSVLKFDVNKNSNICPNIGEFTKNVKSGTIMGAFSNVSEPYDFTSSKNFATFTFDVIGTGNTVVDLNVKTLSVGYFKNNVLDYTNAVKNGSIIDLSKTSGFTGSSLSGVTSISGDLVYGDVNDDGTISIDDVTLIQKYLADLSSLTSEQTVVADVDHDGYVTIIDATLIQKYITGLVSSF
ncbi:MAG: hypothetical protein J1E85_05625 [Ruminococcus sp.]|nr:hypothetical protein [Ruminococcus sp.]